MVKPQDKTAPGEPGAADQAAPGGDHVESLGAIAQLGAQLEAPAAAPGAQTPADAQAAKAVAAAEISAALTLLRAAALPFAPDHVQEPLALVWSDKQLDQVGAAIVEICALYGWTVGDFFDSYGPYIQLFMALGLPALATIKLLKIPPPKLEQPTTGPTDGQQQ